MELRTSFDGCELFRLRNDEAEETASSQFLKSLLYLVWEICRLFAFAHLLLCALNDNFYYLANNKFMWNYARKFTENSVDPVADGNLH